jgi:DNA-binding NarL/FixJ family response regulator
VADDGAGFDVADADARRPGMGLFVMRERVALVGGAVAVESRPGDGTRVRATVPLGPPAAAPAGRAPPPARRHPTRRGPRVTAELIRVVLADDHAVVRAGLRAVLGAAKDIEVVGEARSGREAVALAERVRPDVVVMDLGMDDMSGTEATREITARALPTKVLVLTMHAEEEYLVPAIEAGAAGYLVKSAADRELVDAVRGVAYGDGYFRAAAARVLARRVGKPDPNKAERDRYERLTDREKAVLRMTAEGYSAPEIGEKLSISPKTVDTYKQRVNEKLGLDGRPGYVQFALRLGLLTPAAPNAPGRRGRRPRPPAARR